MRKMIDAKSHELYSSTLDLDVANAEFTFGQQWNPQAARSLPLTLREYSRRAPEIRGLAHQYPRRAPLFGFVAYK